MMAAFITFQAAEAERKIISAVKLGHYLTGPGSPDTPKIAERKAELLQSVRTGIDINPHYRKITFVVADQLAAQDDWTNAIWIWESMMVSRPHIPGIWSNLARGYTHLGKNSQALQALKHWQQLQPDAPGARALEVLLISRTGHEMQATQILTDYFNQGRYDYDLIQIGYVLGLETKNWPLAIRSLELRNTTWPEQAADGHLRLGKIFSDPRVHDDAKALSEFRAGLQAVPSEQKDNFRNQVPELFRVKLNDTETKTRWFH
jgi:tetratricopeptide (TPR) repeat protein